VKSVFKKIAGKLVKISEGAENSLYYDAKTASNYITFKKAYKAAKNSPSLKMAQYIPNGVKDPVRLAKEAADYDAYRAKELTEKIQKRYPKDEFSQFRGKKKAEKLIGMFDGVKDIMMGAPKKAIPLSEAELLKKAKQPLSKRDFWDILNDRPNMQKGSFLSDAAEIAEPQSRGGIGRTGFLQRLNMRKKSAMRVLKEAKPQLGKAAPVDRAINARAKGIRFVRINGKIRPIRAKK
jgi:hypothetical protein